MYGLVGAGLKSVRESCEFACSPEGTVERFGHVSRPSGLFVFSHPTQDYVLG